MEISVINDCVHTAEIRWSINRRLQESNAASIGQEQQNKQTSRPFRTAQANN